MKKTHNAIAFSLIILVLTISILAWNVVHKDSDEINNIPTVKIEDNLPDDAGFPLALESIGNLYDVDTITSEWGKREREIHLPKYLPEKLKIMGAWARNYEGEVGSFAIIVFSEENDTAITTAELVIEVTEREGIPFDPKVSKGTFTEIKGCKAYLEDEAAVGWPEYRKKYGPTSRLIDIQIGSNNYWIRGIPRYSMDEMIKIAESMVPS